MLKNFLRENIIEAGCDEAGRGCLAGPVFAAAVILPRDFFHPLLNDSKQVTPEHRAELRMFIEQHAVSYAVAKVDHEEIDRINILKASFKAMHLAVKKLKQKPQLLLIDGNRFTPYKRIPHECVVQGDGIYASIAAASILAKTYRDDFMIRLHKKHPQYGWNTNKAYATPCHRRAIEEHGLTPYHRRSFQCLSPQLELELTEELIVQEPLTAVP
ncbi:MAG TPA: ribonuclease HII [Chitinophagaceae bacterium]|nr:ribonuclease HII [Chitinophagaceae bacterium]